MIAGHCFFEDIGRLFDAGERRHGQVLHLLADRAVVSFHAQHGQEFLPPAHVMAVAERDLFNPVRPGELHSLFRYGMSTSSHCQFRIFVAIGGQLVIIQFGVLSVGELPGQPDIITIFLTPSSPASRKVFSTTS